jgi:hypothetical protein
MQQASNIIRDYAHLTLYIWSRMAAITRTSALAAAQGHSIPDDNLHLLGSYAVQRAMSVATLYLLTQQSECCTEYRGNREPARTLGSHSFLYRRNALALWFPILAMVKIGYERYQALNSQQRRWVLLHTPSCCVRLRKGRTTQDA